MKINRILLVEDNSDDEYLALRSLSKAGFGQVDVARDGKEALKMLLDSDDVTPSLPDLVILDLRLPIISGIEVLRRLRAAKHTRDLPVLVLTSSENCRDKEICNALGIVAFVSKPLYPATMLELFPANN